MIIKSMSRKDPSFEQLTSYMLAADGASIELRHNLPVAANTAEQVISEFQKEHARLPFRANGTAMFHEILALEPNLERSKKKQIVALRKIAEQYLTRRAPLQLAIGVIHAQTAHVHMHLMISSNAILSRRRISLPKSEFAAIQREIEEFRIQHFPELGNKRLFDQPKKEKTRTIREQAASLRSGKPSHKDELAAALATIFENCKSREGLNIALADLDLKLCQRGRSVGVQTDGGRRYRFKTLGLVEHYTEAVTRFELLESRLADLEKAQGRGKNEAELER